MELGLNFGTGAYKDDAPDGASDTGSLAQVTDSQVCLALLRSLGKDQGALAAIDIALLWGF